MNRITWQCPVCERAIEVRVTSSHDGGTEITDYSVDISAFNQHLMLHYNADRVSVTVQSSFVE